jgi:hypothetical protein
MIMGWLPFLALIILFQIIVFTIHRMRMASRLNRRNFTLIVTFFFSSVFAFGVFSQADGLVNDVFIWLALTVFQLIVAYSLAPFLGINGDKRR